MTLPLIIFDCDGVLVDTEALANNRMAKLYTEIGFTVSGHDCRARFQGKSMTDVCAEISRVIGKSVDPQAIQGEINQALKCNVKAVSGAEQLVEGLMNKGYPICVASSGSIDKMHTTLSQTNLLKTLKDVLFTADDVKRGKPFPDVFQHAAKQMDANIKTAIIIEDSISGVLAGKAAGAKVLGYCGDPFTDEKALEKAGAEVFSDMNEVMGLLKT